MAKIRLVYNFSGIPQDVIIAWFEFSAPNAEIGRFVLDGTVDHEKVGEHTIADLNPVMHRVKFYESSDGVTLETLLVSADIDASLISVPVAEFIEFQVGVTAGAPAHGDSQYVNTDLDDPDITDYVVEQRGFGNLSWNTEINEIAGGGFEFINGWTFNQDDTYFITIYKMVQQQSTSITTQNQFIDVEIISANDTFDADLYNKLLIADFVGVGVGVIDVPDFGTIPNHTMLHLNTHSGEQRYVTLQFDSDAIRFMGEYRTAIHLGRGEEIRILFMDGNGYVVSYSGGYGLVGERRLGNKPGMNELLLDGTEYLIADYPRIWDYIQSLPATQLVTYAAWGQVQAVTVAGNVINRYPNKGLFAQSVDGLSFKVPDDRNMFYRAMKYPLNEDIDTERLTQAVGGLQAQQIIGHGHGIKSTASGASVNDTADVVRGQIVGTVSTRGGAAKIGDDNYTIALTGGAEERPDNIGLMPLLKI
jgi:hypothetical protein